LNRRRLRTDGAGDHKIRRADDGMLVLWPLPEVHLETGKAITRIRWMLTERGERLLSDRLDRFLHRKHARGLAGLLLGRVVPRRV
jgi:hypothetical protein